MNNLKTIWKFSGMKKAKIFLFILICTLAFSVDKKTLEYWEKTMKFGISSQRSAVIKSIEEKKATEAYFLIEKALLSDPNPDIRGNASYSLINLKIDKEELWNKALNSEVNSDVLRKIVYGIGELKIKSIAPKLYPILMSKITNQKETDLCATIIRTIGILEHKEENDNIVNILTNIEYNNDIRSSAALCLGYLNDSKNISVLSKILENPGESIELRMYCAFAIGKTGDPQAISILTPYIENEREVLNVRLWAVAGLSYVNYPGVFEKLIQFTKTDNTKIRIESIRALGRLANNPEAIELLKYKARYDPEPTVQKEAINVLKKMGIDIEKIKKEENFSSISSIQSFVSNTKSSSLMNTNVDISNK